VKDEFSSRALLQSTKYGGRACSAAAAECGGGGSAPPTVVGPARPDVDAAGRGRREHGEQQRGRGAAQGQVGRAEPATDHGCVERAEGFAVWIGHLCAADPLRCAVLGYGACWTATAIWRSR